MTTVRKIKLLLLIICAAVAFSGCTAVGLDNSDIMRPPRDTGDKAEIQRIIEEQVGGDYVLKYPQSGAYRSAIILSDLDHDGNEEAIAFYAPAADTSAINVIFMKEIDSRWQKAGLFSAHGTAINTVFIENVKDNSSKNVIIGWESSVENRLSIYSINNEYDFEEVVLNQTYSQIIIDKITNVDISDILLISLASQQKPANAKLVSYSTKSEKFVQLSTAEISNQMVKFANISSGLVYGNVKGAFIDGITPESQYITEFIYWDKEKETLINPFREPDAGNNPTLRSTTNVCRDVNEDRITEIPIVTKSKKEADEDESTVHNIIDWQAYNIKDKSFSTVCYSVMQNSDGYYFILPEEWMDKVVARRDNQSRSLTFYSWNDSGKGELGSELLTIQVFTQKEWDTNRSGFTEMQNNSSLVYAVKLTNDLPANEQDLKITMEIVAENLKLITTDKN